MTGWQIEVTSGSATALRTTSGPMPAGSPIVMPTRGRVVTGSAASCLRVSIAESAVAHHATAGRLAFRDVSVVVFDAHHLRRAFFTLPLRHSLFGLKDIFDVSL